MQNIGIFSNLLLYASVLIPICIYMAGATWCSYKLLASDYMPSKEFLFFSSLLQSVILMCFIFNLETINSFNNIAYILLVFILSPFVYGEFVKREDQSYIRGLVLYLMIFCLSIFVVVPLLYYGILDEYHAYFINSVENGRQGFELYLYLIIYFFLNLQTFNAVLIILGENSYEGFLNNWFIIKISSYDTFKRNFIYGKIFSVLSFVASLVCTILCLSTPVFSVVFGFIAICSIFAFFRNIIAWHIINLTHFNPLLWAINYLYTKKYTEDEDKFHQTRKYLIYLQIAVLPYIIFLIFASLTYVNKN